MSDLHGILIQVGGVGKGSGKTSLIIRLLEYFPNSAFVKSALHVNSLSPHGGDDSRCSDAGAGSAVTIDRTDETQLMDAIKAARVDYEIVFLEKNSRLKSLAPDLYLFMETNVKSVRDDCMKLRYCADIVLQYPVVDDKLHEVIQRIRELRQCSLENYSRG